MDIKDAILIEVDKNISAKDALKKLLTFIEITHKL